MTMKCDGAFTRSTIKAWCSRIKATRSRINASRSFFNRSRAVRSEHAALICRTVLTCESDEAICEWPCELGQVPLELAFNRSLAVR